MQPALPPRDGGCSRRLSRGVNCFTEQLWSSAPKAVGRNLGRHAHSSPLTCSISSFINCKISTVMLHFLLFSSLVGYAWAKTVTYDWYIRWRLVRCVFTTPRSSLTSARQRQTVSLDLSSVSMGYGRRRALIPRCNC
ncbi:uncharacterized protein CC84DRAFT_357355 [Paraphaeosphaeria sporulosa]|uniref:Uncharacterized protein n=1 Tax=Paraphaeosphaeria sporulosa TaxID=1460663 RepID=A0A177BZL6_9PLEO|nr:uncharacterized protein CC84DRAFT_357355 [Paraphaeosphaeria sporulosa]OAG00032.1 hypothetical protein CC84DRAFT_357355 [Paraphaeosphaeria sporulosa]